MPRANRQRRRRSRLSTARASARLAVLYLEIADRAEQAEADELGMEPHKLRYLRERGIDPRAPVPRLFGDRIDAIAAARAGAHPPLAIPTSYTLPVMLSLSSLLPPPPTAAEAKADLLRLADAVPEVDLAPGPRGSWLTDEEALEIERALAEAPAPHPFVVIPYDDPPPDR